MKCPVCNTEYASELAPRKRDDEKDKDKDIPQCPT